MVVDTRGRKSKIRIDCSGLSFEQRIKMHEIEKRFDLSLVAEDNYMKLAAVMPRFMIDRFIAAYRKCGWATVAECVYQNTMHFEFYRDGYDSLE